MSAPDKNKFKRIILLVDFICLCGLGMLGTGLWWYDPKISMIIMGVIICVMAFFISASIAAEKRNSRG